MSKRLVKHVSSMLMRSIVLEKLAVHSRKSLASLYLTQESSRPSRVQVEASHRRHKSESIYLIEATLKFTKVVAPVERFESSSQMNTL